MKWFAHKGVALEPSKVGTKCEEKNCPPTGRAPLRDIISEIYHRIWWSRRKMNAWKSSHRQYLKNWIQIKWTNWTYCIVLCHDYFRKLDCRPCLAHKRLMNTTEHWRIQNASMSQVATLEFDAMCGNCVWGKIIMFDLWTESLRDLLGSQSVDDEKNVQWTFDSKQVNYSSTKYIPTNPSSLLWQ